MLKLHKSENPSEVAVTVTNETFIRLALLTVGLIILFFAVKKAEHALVLIFVSFFLTIALNAPVYSLSRHLPGKRKGNRALATTISFLIVIIALGAFIAIIVPPLIHQTDRLVNAAPRSVKDLRSQNSAVGKFIRQHNLEKQVNTIATQLSDRLQHIGGTAFSTAKHVGESIFSVLTILVLTFMMLVEGPRWMGFFKEVLPDKHHNLADRLLADMYKVIRGYVNGQVILAAIASVAIMPAVLLLHISYPAGLIVVIFICGLIPLVGHSIGAVIVSTVALFHSPEAALIILLYYIVYIQLENYIIQPKLMANTTNMSPLLVFGAVIVGISFSGIFGGLLAIPVAGCIRIILLEFLRAKKIIDTPEFNSITSPEAK
jgi:predicted PurR-regulated permease PerM